MKRNWSALYLIAFILVLTCFTGAKATEGKFDLVQELSPFEPFEALTFHAGNLWVASSRNGLGAQYTLTAYDASGNQVAEKELEHSPRYLYPYGTDSVLTVGVAASDNLTHYSVITARGKSVSVRSWTVPLGAYANEAAGRPGALYFTDPGGLDDGSPIGVALRTVFAMNGTSFRYLKTRIHGPRYPVLVGNDLYAIEYPSMFAGRSLIQIDPNAEAPKKLYTGNNLVKLVAIDGGQALALADRDTSEVVILDRKTNAVIRKIAIEGQRPKGIAELGKCLVVGSEETKRVSVFLWKEGKLVADFDLSGVGPKLYGIRNVAANAQTGQIFVRSAYPASPTDPVTERNSIYRITDTSGTLAAQCR